MKYNVQIKDPQGNLSVGSFTIRNSMLIPGITGVVGDKQDSIKWHKINDMNDFLRANASTILARTLKPGSVIEIKKHLIEITSVERD